MYPQIKIGGISEAEAYMKNGWPDITVSVISPGVTMNTMIDSTKHLIVRCDDIPHPDMSDYPPELHHLVSALEFTKNMKPGDKLLVNCHMGIARSTATAIAIAINWGMTYLEAFEYVKSIRDILRPNKIITELTDKYFKLDGKLIDLVIANEIEYSTRAKENSSKIITNFDADIRKQDVDLMRSILKKFKEG